MTDKAKKRLLDIFGAIVSFALPAAAAISEFPRVKTATGGADSFLSVVNLSATAFSIIAIIGAITAMRFFHHRLKMPKSGLAVSVILYVIVRGINVIIDPMETILFWAVIGCGIAWVLYLIADKKYGGANNGQ